MRSQGDDAVRAYQDEHRLAYQTEAPVNWCPALGTVLANEEVVNGKSEVGGHPVVRMPLRQWMLRITAYADRLEKDLESLDWSEGIKALQRNWIGRSTGAEVDFFIGNDNERVDGKPTTVAWDAYLTEWHNSSIGCSESKRISKFLAKPKDSILRVYTTRPDTLFGATYMVIAPEHPFVDRGLPTPENASQVRTIVSRLLERATWTAPNLRKKRPACSPVATQSIR